MNLRTVIIIAIIVLASASFIAFRQSADSPIDGELSRREMNKANNQTENRTNASDSSGTGNPAKPNIEIIAENLNIPWAVLFLPDGGVLATERPGTLAVIKNGNVGRIPVDGVYHFGEGGLLGAVLHPDFKENRFLYLYMTYRGINGGARNKVERYKFENGALSDKTIVIDEIPGAANHNGGMIAFGPDRYLYVTTGDAGNSSLAQNISSLAGKILRLGGDGSIPADNPFGNPVYSYGHRNPQGLVWDDKGRLWSTEHGRSGIQSGLDELNLIQKGENYGWPVIEGSESRRGMESPALHSGADKTWAPAGITFLNGLLFWGGLRGEALYEARISGNDVTEFAELFHERFGRIRAVVLGYDGSIYITTSNTDGRGEPEAGDDKLIKINTAVLNPI